MNNYNPIPISQIDDIICDMRHDILTMVHNCGKQNGHLGGCMSAVEILAVLYTQVMNVNEIAHSDREWSDRDRFIMSKGHAGIAMYAAMKHVGLISQEMIDNSIRGENSILYRHPKRNIEYGIECSVGSLGMGLGYGNGLAESFKRKGTDQKVYVMIGDGECDEGSVWESAAYASHRKLDNIVVIIDKNKLQLDGPTKNVLSMENMTERWSSFGFKTVEIDGHNTAEIIEAFNINHKGKPLAIIANTIKGKGMSFAENKIEWHDNYLSNKLYEQGKAELGSKDLNYVREAASIRFASKKINISRCIKEKKIRLNDCKEQIAEWQSLGPKNVIGGVASQIAEQDNLFALVYSDCANRIGINELLAKHPEMCYETGIAEQNQVAMAAAMAHEGFHVFAVAYAPFITARVLDQIRANLGYMKANVCLIGLGAGMASSDLGATHTAFEDLANMRSIPNMLVNAPADVYEIAKGMESFINSPQPMYLRITAGENTYFDTNTKYNIYKSDIIGDGADVAIVVVGTLLREAIKASTILEKIGVRATVINARTVKPIDEGLLLNLKKFDKIVTVEEHSVIGGLGSAIAEKMMQQGCGAIIKMIGVQDEYFYADTSSELLAKCGLIASCLADSIKNFIS